MAASDRDMLLFGGGGSMPFRFSRASNAPVQLTKPVLPDGDRPAVVAPVASELSGLRSGRTPPPAPGPVESLPMRPGSTASSRHRGLAARLWTVLAALLLGQQRR